MNKISLIEGCIGFFVFPVLDIFEMFFFFGFCTQNLWFFGFGIQCGFRFSPFLGQIRFLVFIDRKAVFWFLLFACLVLRPRRFRSLFSAVFRF